VRSLIITLSFLVLASLGCIKSKLSDAAPNYDQANKIFRVIIDANALYYVSIISSAPDTISTQSSAGLEFNYGFATKVGDAIVLKVISPKATSLTWTVLYAGRQVSPSVTTTQLPGGGLEADYKYVVAK
jgi:hypothetical protein